MLISQSNAQALKLVDMEKLFKQTIDNMDTYLSAKGFEYQGLEDQGDYDAYKYKRGELVKSEYIIKYQYDNGTVIFSYSFFNTKTYTAIKKSIASSGFKYVKQETFDDALVLKYKKGKSDLTIFSGTNTTSSGEVYKNYEVMMSIEISE
jgi:hypothetical protein